VQSLLVSESFVVFLALAGGAEPLDLPGAPVDDEVVLDAVALLLAAVDLPLPLWILGTLDGALHSVNDELESLAFAQHRLEVAGLSGWELLLVVERCIEERGQTVNPLVGPAAGSSRRADPALLGWGRAGNRLG